MSTIGAGARHDLSDSQWKMLQPLLPQPSPLGRPRAWPLRGLIDGIRHRVRGGYPWRDVPERYGPWWRVYALFALWQVQGVWERIETALLTQANARGRICWQVSIDSTTSRGHVHAAGARRDSVNRVAGEPDHHGFGRSRGGWSTKTHALVIPAFSLALVGLVQGAGISGSTPNPDGSYPDASDDFRGQGVANLVAGVAQGMPVGGSMSATSLVRNAGARSALAPLVAAVVMALTILLVSDLIAVTAMPALGALLVIVGTRTLRPANLAMVWRTGAIQASVLAMTFVMTLVVPLQYAVLSGVALAVLLHVTSQSNRITLVRWVFDDGVALPREVPPPAMLEAGEIVVLVPYGSLFFAAAPRLEAQLPALRGDATDAYVVLRLRGSDDLGSTAIGLLTSYAVRCRAAGATLVLAGVGARVLEQLRATRSLAEIGEENVFAATDRLGASIGAALTHIEARRDRA